MDYIDYITLGRWQKFGINFKKFIKNLPKNLLKLIKKIWSVIQAFFISIATLGKTLFTIIKHGDFRTRLSFLIMGSGSLLRGQIVKGVIYLFIEASFIVYLVTFGLEYLKLLPTLGTAIKIEVWDAELEIFTYAQGHNSMLILLFGVVTIFVIIAFLMVYISNIKSAYANQQIIESGKKLPNVFAEIKTLLDARYHVTLLSLPILGVIAFTVLPLVFMILIAFTNYDRFHQPPGNLFTWVGFANFKAVFWDDPIKSYTFTKVFQWTIVWAVFATFTNYIFGMILAMMINKKGIKLKAMWRTIFVITIAVPAFVSLLLMSKILHDQGPLNVLLMNLNIISEPIPFLTNTLYARISVIVVNMWVGIPYTMLITTGILMNIPADLYESARIDGAGPVKAFTKITLPYMLFITTPYLITQFIGNINNFNVIFLLSGGGPLSLDYFQAGKTDLLVTWLYKLTVNEQNYSLASTIGIIIFVICATISLIVYNSTGSVKNEEDFQ